MLAYVVIYASDSAFYQTPETVNRLRMNIARDVDLFRVIDALVQIALFFQTVISSPLISKNRGRW